MSEWSYEQKSTRLYVPISCSGLVCPEDVSLVVKSTVANECFIYLKNGAVAQVPMEAEAVVSAILDGLKQENEQQRKT